ncbi:MAG: hypothetical protein ACI9BD_001239 [Candidatus Marinamargulisbacteria bacterium]|jgi:hypothetical protein
MQSSYQAFLPPQAAAAKNSSDLNHELSDAKTKTTISTFRQAGKDFITIRIAPVNGLESSTIDLRITRNNFVSLDPDSAIPQENVLITVKTQGTFKQIDVADKAGTVSSKFLVSNTGDLKFPKRFSFF